MNSPCHKFSLSVGASVSLVPKSVAEVRVSFWCPNGITKVVVLVEWGKRFHASHPGANFVWVKFFDLTLSWGCHSLYLIKTHEKPLASVVYVAVFRLPRVIYD